MEASPAFAWAILLFLGLFTLRMFPFINVDLAVRFQMWVRDMVERMEREIDKSDKDDD